MKLLKFLSNKDFERTASGFPLNLQIIECLQTGVTLTPLSSLSASNTLLYLAVWHLCFNQSPSFLHDALLPPLVGFGELHPALTLVLWTCVCVCLHVCVIVCIVHLDSFTSHVFVKWISGSRPCSNEPPAECTRAVFQDIKEFPLASSSPGHRAAC